MQFGGVGVGSTQVPGAAGVGGNAHMPSAVEPGSTNVLSTVGDRRQAANKQPNLG